MCTRTTASYEEELWGAKVENKPQRQLLDAVFSLQPRVVLHRADITEYLHRERQKPEIPHNIKEVEDEEVHHIKEEEEPNLVKKQGEGAHPHIKEGEKLDPAPVKNEDAEEYLHIRHEVEEDIKFPLIGVPLRRVDEGQSEERRGAEPPNSSSSQHIATEGDGTHCGGSQPDGLLATSSDSDDATSHSSDYDDERGQAQINMTLQTDKKQWNCSQCGKTFVNDSSLKKHMKTHSGEKLFACLVCGQRFSRKQHLRHARTHNGKPAGLFDKRHSDRAPSLKLAAEKFNRSSRVQTHKSTKHMTRSKQMQNRKHPTAQALLELSCIQGEHSYAKQATHSETPVTDSSSKCVDKSSLSDDATSSRSKNLTSESAEKQSCSSQQCKMKSEGYQRLLIENSNLKSALGRSRITQETFKDNDKKVNYYTGLQSYKTLIAIFEYIEEFIPERTHTHRSLSKFQKFILALMKLRHNFFEQDLAYRFDVSQATVSSTFLSVIHVMYIRLQRYIYWPEREDLRMSMPLEFRKYFSLKVRVIISCLEILIERPSDLKSRAQTWSSDKHHNTVKYLLGMTPQGSVSFISKGWGGRTSDKYITENCGLLKKLLPGDVVLAYRGFDTKQCLGFMCAEVKIPGFTKGRSQLPRLETERTRSIAHVRIHVERVMSLVRNKYTILSGTFPMGYLLSPNGSTPAVDKIVTVCCCLANFCASAAPFN
ncbi:uncharacterized protein LOC133493620 isoform X2 [Syngnathoides biaculeatus]|nr:uncharacterized protein LOC133493620 isoform X2 [Syngnathoides biaculeatus]